MNKKTILFISLIICFLSVLVILAYVGIIEKQKINKEERIAETVLNDNGTARTDLVNRLPMEKEINWGTITPEYFLAEDIFNTDLKTSIEEIKTLRNDNIETMFARGWRDKENNSVIGIIVTEHKDKFPKSSLRDENQNNVVKQTSENTTMTYLGSFTFNDEVVENNKFEIKKGEDVETEFSLMWFENRFSFSIKTISEEYQDDIKEIAENIINKYSNK